MSADSVPHPSSEPPFGAAPARLSQRLRRRLAALSAVGALMVVLPLVQVLRYQNAEVQALLDERAALDPVERAVQVQRALLAHRDIAGQVLRGSPALEPARRLRQGEVDDRLLALAAALDAGAWPRASLEADALRTDWLLLVRQLLARSLNPSESDQSHRLLVEQTLQVIDLVGDFALPHAALDGAAVPVRQARLVLLRDLPQAAATPAQWAAFEQTLAGARKVLDLQTQRTRQQRTRLLSVLAGLAAAAAALLWQLWRGLRGPPTPTPESPEGEAVSPPRAEAGRLLSRLREAAPAPEPRPEQAPQQLP